MASSAILSAPDYEVENTSPQALAEQIIAGIRTDLVQDRLVWPSIPAIALTVRKLMQRADTSLAEIVHVVSMDPALSTRVLRMANTEDFGAARDCATLVLALQRLGPRAIGQVTELFVAGQIYNVGNRRRIQPHLRRLWRRSTRVASICRQITATHPDLEPGIALVAGLIHAIGVLPVLVHAENIPRLLSQHELLNSVIEIVHREVSEVLLTTWGFPADLVAVAASHQDPYHETPGAPSYVDVVTLANLLSYIGTDHHHASIGLAKVPAADKLGISAHDVADLLTCAKQNEATFWRHPATCK